MFEDLFERLALELDAQEILYMIIGGHAVLLYGEPRLTRDIDLVLDLSLDGLERVLSLTEKLGLEPLADPHAFARSTMVLPCRDPGTDIRVDFIFTSTPYEHHAMGRARAVKMGKALVRFASLEDVIIHKCLAGRPRDLEDVKAMVIKNEKIDMPYISEWLMAFAESLNEPVVERFNYALKHTN